MTCFFFSLVIFGACVTLSSFVRFYVFVPQFLGPMEEKGEELRQMRRETQAGRHALLEKTLAKAESKAPSPVQSLEKPPGVFVRGYDKPREPSKPPSRAATKRVVGPSTAPEPAKKVAKQADAVEPDRTVPVPVGPPSDSLCSGRILTMDDVFERYTEADVVRIVRWYEGVRITIPELPRRSDE